VRGVAASPAESTADWGGFPALLKPDLDGTDDAMGGAGGTYQVVQFMTILGFMVESDGLAGVACRVDMNIRRAVWCSLREEFVK
jgi:hypothetical protein